MNIDEAIKAAQHRDPRPFIENFIGIPTKQNSIAPFQLNRLQKYVHKNETGRDYWLKYRQGGSSVYQIAKNLVYCICVPNFTAAGLTISTDNGRQKKILFNHIDTFLQWMRPEAKPTVTRYDQNGYIEFMNGSVFFVSTVGSGEFGRGVTINSLWVTELGSFTPKEADQTLNSGLESVVPGGLIAFETTPKLIGSPAHQFYLECKADKKPYKAHFTPWWFSEDYFIPPGSVDALPSDRGAIILTEAERKLAERFFDDDIPVEDRIRWRRAKIADRETNFFAEYPEDEASCVASDTVIYLPNGKKEVVSRLAAQDYKGEVLTVGSDGVLTSGKVTKWYRSPRRNRRVFRLSYKHAKMAHGIQTRTVLTEEHKVLTGRGWVPVSLIEQGDTVATGTPAPSQKTMQLVLGMVLGDGSVSRRNTLATAQVDDELVELRAKMLEAFTPRRKNYQQRGFGEKQVYAFNTKPAPFWAYLRSKFYPEGTKRIPRDLIAGLTDFGIATWFMDDGHTRPWRGTMRPVAEIATGVLPEDDVRFLCEVLTSRGYDCNVRVQSGVYHKVQFTTDGTKRLLEAISPYVVPSMRYKLRGYGVDFDETAYDPEPTETFWDEVEATEIPVPMVHRKGRLVEKHSTFYCMDVEDTHNFVTPGGVVHNCWLSATTSVFPIEKLRTMFSDIQKPQEDIPGVRIFIDGAPERQYVCGVDAAGGIPGQDFSAAVVLDVITGRVAATIHGYFSPPEMARKVAELGLRYNRYMVGGERDAWTSQVMDELRKMGWADFYYHDDGGKTVDIGFPNTNTSRLQAVARLRDAINQNDFFTTDEDLLLELVQYTRVTDERGVERYGAPEGLHDDLCVAAQRAQQMRVTVPAGGAYAPVRSEGLVALYPGTGW